MDNINLDYWWASLAICEKERIARKIATKKAHGSPFSDSEWQYPGCTSTWESLDETRKQAIYIHCVNQHGDILKDWDDANPYGD